VAAVGISFSRPALYRSRTLISVDAGNRQSIDKELTKQVQELLVQPALVSIIQSENLYPRERARMPLNQVVDLMRKNIWLRHLQTSHGKTSSGFVLEFTYPDPHIAQKVDAELVSRFVAANLQARQTASAETTDFLENELAAANDPAIKSRIQSQLLQAQAGPQFHETFRVLNAASLPQRPDGLSRIKSTALGLLVGLAAGLGAAALTDWRRRLTTFNG
jgi:uncharacterized protein involved in exopolysaccharide biosynthesis